MRRIKSKIKVHTVPVISYPRTNKAPGRYLSRRILAILKITTRYPVA